MKRSPDDDESDGSDGKRARVGGNGSTVGGDGSPAVTVACWDASVETSDVDFAKSIGVGVDAIAAARAGDGLALAARQRVEGTRLKEFAAIRKSLARGRRGHRTFVF